MAEDLPPAANVRIGHRERDAVVAALQEAAADGRLSIAELEDRLEAALQAKTYADLDPLVPARIHSVSTVAQVPRRVEGCGRCHRSC